MCICVSVVTDIRQLKLYASSTSPQVFPSAVVLCNCRPAARVSVCRTPRVCLDSFSPVLVGSVQPPAVTLPCPSSLLVHGKKMIKQRSWGRTGPNYSKPFRYCFSVNDSRVRAAAAAPDRPRLSSAQLGLPWTSACFSSVCWAVMWPRSWSCTVTAHSLIVLVCNE